MSDASPPSYEVPVDSGPQARMEEVSLRIERRDDEFFTGGRAFLARITDENGALKILRRGK